MYMEIPIVRNSDGIAVLKLVDKYGNVAGEQLVDDDIYYKFKLISMHMDGGYCKGKTNGLNFILSRLIMNCDDPKTVVDHINSITKDNRRVNLRVVSHLRNGQNKSKAKDKLSKYLGVSYCNKSKSKKWKAYIKVNKKSLDLGRFKTEREAVIARNNKVIEVNALGNIYKLNTIED